jgi:hypothetical protein
VIKRIETTAAKGPKVALVLVAWLVGLTGLLHGACTSCQKADLARASHCPDEAVERLQAECCEEPAGLATAVCCLPREAEEPAIEARPVVPPSAPQATLAQAATLQPATFGRDGVRRLAALDEPPRLDGVGLHILHSALLI